MSSCDDVATVSASTYPFHLAHQSLSSNCIHTNSPYEDLYISSHIASWDCELRHLGHPSENVDAGNLENCRHTCTILSYCKHKLYQVFINMY